MSQQRGQPIDSAFQSAFEELHRVVPNAAHGDDAMESLLAVIDQHLKPLADHTAHNTRTAKLIAQYAKALEQRAPDRRPRTRAGALKSLEAFVTRDIRSTLKEYASFEAQAEKTLTEHLAMYLMARGVARHQERALGLIDRFMMSMATQWERLSTFRTRIHTLEHEYFDHDDWVLHLHDRINRLANMLTAIDAAATSLKRAIISKRPFDAALESLRALRDDSLNPLEFIYKVFAGHDHPYAIEIKQPDPPLRYSNHFLVREILMELVHNAIANNANCIRLFISTRDVHTATIAIEDNCPGGIPAEIALRIGNERIPDGQAGNTAELHAGRSFSRGWGLFTVHHNLIPHLGESASISFQSPLTPHGGTRFSIVVPIIDRQKATARAQPSLRCAFQSLDPFAAGGRAMSSTHFTSRIVLPLALIN